MGLDMIDEVWEVEDVWNLYAATRNGLLVHLE
jgi:hypothetical protein